MRHRLVIKVEAKDVALIDSEGTYSEQTAGNLLQQATYELQSLGLMLQPVKPQAGESMRMTVFQQVSETRWTSVGSIAISPVE